MANRMKYLMNLEVYLSSVDKLTNEDDLYLYKETLKHSKNGNITISEGLIKTHPIEKSVEIIKSRFKELSVDIEEDGEIYIHGEFGELQKYIPLFNNLGYFISTITIDGEKWLNDFGESDIPKALFLEAKYDMEIIDIAKILYHASPLKYKEKILKNGLQLKSLNKISRHPDRIYLTKDILTAKLFTKQFNKEYSKYYEDGFVIYSINSDGIHKLYSDVNLRNGGYYTTHNIRPEFIKIAFKTK